MGTEGPKEMSRAPAQREDRRGAVATRKWFCGCKQPPVLLGTLDRTGEIHLKARDRYWHVRGSVTALCPRCGCEHVLDATNTNRTAVVLNAAGGTEAASTV